MGSGTSVHENCSYELRCANSAHFLAVESALGMGTNMTTMTVTGKQDWLRCSGVRSLRPWVAGVIPWGNFPSQKTSCT